MMQEKENKTEQWLKQEEQKVLTPPTSSGLREQDYPCKQKGQNKFACITRSCTHYAFLCSDQACLCHKSHQKCLIIKASCIQTNLQDRIISSKPIEDCISDKVDKAIDSLSDQKDKLILQIKSKFAYFGLTQWQKTVYKTLKNQQQSDITGHELWQLHLCVKNIKLQKSIFQIHSPKINKIFLQAQKYTEVAFIETSNYLNQIKSRTEQYLCHKENLLNQTYAYIQDAQVFTAMKKVDKLFENSKIVNLLDAHRIKAMFQSKRLSSTKLLYRASENEFLVSKFREEFRFYYPTLTVIRTQFDQKIGGFNPLDWSININSSYKKDQKGQSFIFSLTNNEKFCLQEDQNAIYSVKQYGPSFGRTDIRIGDLANKKQSSSVGLSNTYNKNYSRNKINNNMIQSKRLTGFSGSFKIKQWQVWQISFQ